MRYHINNGIQSQGNRDMNRNNSIVNNSDMWLLMLLVLLIGGAWWYTQEEGRPQRYIGRIGVGNDALSPQL